MSTDRLPKDLPGGWEYTTPFSPVPLQKGQIWRKRGPVDALKILRVMMPGHKEYDGAAQGISVRPSVVTRAGRVRWSSQSWFHLGDEAALHSHLEENGYSLATSPTINPIADHQEALQFMQQATGLFLDEDQHTQAQSILSSIGSGATIAEFAQLAVKAQPLRKFAIKLGAHCLPGEGYANLFRRDYGSLEVSDVR